MNRNVKQYLKVGINIFIALLILAIFIFLVPKLLVFFMPFLIGWIIACIANPTVKFFEEKLKIKRKAMSAVVIVVVLSLVVLLLYAIGSVLVKQGIGFVEELPEKLKALQEDWNNSASSGRWDALYERLPASVQSTIDGIGDNANKYMSILIEKISTPTVNAIGGFAMAIPNLIISTIMAILSAYFFVADRGYLNKLFKKLMPLSIQERWSIVATSLKKAIGGYVIAQLKIEIWIYLLLVIGLAILKVEYVFLVALGIAFLDFLPFFGTGTVMVPWAIIEIINGNIPMAIGLLIVWSVGQVVRQFIQPKIMGDSVGLPAIPTLFLLFIGYKIGGVIGMIIALPIGIIILNLNEAGVFNTTKNSIRLFVKKMNDFRRLDENDYAYIRADEPQELREEEEKEEEKEEKIEEEIRKNKRQEK